MQGKTIDKRIYGNLGEDIAARYLQQHGFSLIQRNYRTKVGEIDIIAQKQGVVYFFEVKVRGPGKLIDPLEAITPAKIRRIRRTAEYYLMCHRAVERSPCSFGVIGIDGSREPPHVECILDAFE